jgi:hypothetical protein
LTEAKVGQHNTPDAKTPGLFEVAAGFPAFFAEIRCARGAVGLTVKDDFGPVGKPAFLHGHVSGQILGCAAKRKREEHQRRTQDSMTHPSQ